MAIDEALCDALAELARLELPEEKRAGLARDLETIVGHLASLQAVDVSGVEPFRHPGSGALRADVAGDALPRAQALGVGPHTADPYFVVPKFLEE